MKGKNYLEICQVFPYNDYVSISIGLSLSLIFFLRSQPVNELLNTSAGGKGMNTALHLFPYYIGLVWLFIGVASLQTLALKSGRRCPARLLMFSSVNSLPSIYLRADPLHSKFD